LRSPGLRLPPLLAVISWERRPQKIAEALHAYSALSFRQEKGFHDLLAITGASCCYPNS
jgi:hypothetical protein